MWILRLGLRVKFRDSNYSQGDSESPDPLQPLWVFLVLLEVTHWLAAFRLCYHWRSQLWRQFWWKALISWSEISNQFCSSTDTQVSSSVHTQVHLEVTDFYLSLYVVDSFLILLQPVWHDRHQVEMNLLRTVPRYIPSHTDWLVGHIDMNLLLRNVPRYISSHTDWLAGHI